MPHARMSRIALAPLLLLALLLLLAPALLAAELGLLVVAARDGWLGAKLRAQIATAVGLPAALARRRGVQRTRRIGASEFAAQLTGSFESPNLTVPRTVAALSRIYWRVTRLLLR